MPQSTVGYERAVNWAVGTLDEAAFVREVLAGQPVPPPYFAEMKRLNRAGPPLLGDLVAPKPLDPATLTPAFAATSFIVDVRRAERFAARHVGGALNIPLGASFASRAGWLVPYDRPVFLVAESADDAARAARAMALIGLDRIGGWLGPAALDAYAGAGGALEQVASTTPGELGERMARDEVTVIDVREAGEWNDGHLPGAVHIPLGQLPGRLDEIPMGRPIAVHCQGGTRSAIAASVLLRAGVPDVSNVPGGYAAWIREGHPASTIVRD